MNEPTTGASLHRARADRRAALDRRLGAGERVTGRKISLTSTAAQRRVGTDRPIWGWLTDTMELPDGGTVVCAPGVRTRAEAELVFLLGKDLVGPGVTSRQVLAATEAVCPGIELPSGPVPASPPTVTDLIARNASASAYVVGEPLAGWANLDLSQLGVLLSVDGQVVTSGAGAAVLGHPARAIAQLVNELAREDFSELRAGDLIFSGGLTEPVTLRPGMTVDADFAHLGRISVNVG